MINKFVNKALTPKDLVNKQTLDVPIYQRLFVWEQRQIEKLLDDLLKASKDNTKKPYFIGIITVNEKENDFWEVVDGQQRLTFLTLFGAMCIGHGYSSDLWKQFVYSNSENASLRINYLGREEDSKDINRIISKEFSQVKNINFKIFIECFNRLQPEKWEAYSEYVFEKTSFFVSQLPFNYKPRQLNLFFEKMNSAGRQLEPIDLVKIKFANFADEWNACMNFENSYDPAKQKEASNLDSIGTSLASILENQAQIKIEEESPYRNHIGDQLILKPEVFLLHVLRLKKGKDSKISLDDGKLLETFSNEMKEPTDEEKQDFIKTMKEYRIWLDQNIIYLQADENKSCPYAFRKDTQDIGDDEKNMAMRQFQSMLYVSSTDSQEWVLNAYTECERGKIDLTLDMLRHQDWKQHKTLPKKEEMTYHSINRYWFWKLDFLLWSLAENNQKNNNLFPDFDEKEKKLIKDYVFRRNRSIEHLQPQANPFSTAEDSFGNLAMIAPGTNSSLSYNSINTKFGRIKDMLAGGGNLESIKMLLMFKAAKDENNLEVWDLKKAEAHGDNMYKILENDQEIISTYGENKQ